MMRFPLMSAQVTLPGEALVAVRTLDSLFRAMSFVMPTHILLTRIPKVTPRPRTRNRLYVSSKMIACILVSDKIMSMRVLNSLPFAIFTEGSIATKPIAEPSSILFKFVVFQTRGRNFFERQLAVCLRTRVAFGRFVGRR